MAAPAAPAGGTAAMSRDAFRAAVTNTLERRLFFVPSFKIYGGVAGLYDYGPPGCAVKANVLAFWRQVLHYCHT
jgi:glycyl-tRNA synthetase